MNTLDTSTLISVLGYAIPFISGILCMVVIFIFLIQYYHQSLERKLALLLIAELTVCVFCWVSMISYILYPDVYIRILPLFYLCILYAQVTTFHFVFTLTRTGKREKFNTIHYIIPLILSLISLILVLLTPESVRLDVVRNREIFPEGYKVYAFVATSIPKMFLIYSLLYSILGLRRIFKFKKALEDYSADEGNSSVRWLQLLMYVTLASVPLSMTPILLGMNFFFTSAITLLPSFIIVMKDILLTYNTVANNYVIIEPLEEEKTWKETAEKGSRPDKKHFEAYIRKAKPYLNAQLHISDLAIELKTNRTYLSGFINQEYGMNFSRYINRLRLREVEKLRINPACANMNGMELVQKAGFTNFQGYLRAKRQQDKETTLIN